MYLHTHTQTPTHPRTHARTHTHTHTEADRSVALALLQVAFLGKRDDRGLGPQGWPFSRLADLVAKCRESGNYVLSICLDQFC